MRCFGEQKVDRPWTAWTESIQTAPSGSLLRRFDWRFTSLVWRLSELLQDQLELELGDHVERSQSA